MRNESLKLRFWTVTELLETDFPEPDWIVPGIIPEGMTLLIGDSKVGKSWFVLQLAYDVATGTSRFGISVESPKKVLFFALEDHARRIKDRVTDLGFEKTDNLQFCFAWEKGDGAFTKLVNLLEEQPDIAVVVVDTWGMWTDVIKGNDYHIVTDAAKKLRDITHQFNCSILLIHHRNKSDSSSDFVKGSLGSTGLPSVADTIVGIRRERGERDGVLEVTGRDVDEQSFALSKNDEQRGWLIAGTTQDVQNSKTRQRIVNLLREEGPLDPKAIAEELDANRSTIRNTLRKMVQDSTLNNDNGLYDLRQDE
ncbi:MAG: AAA family ATPase [Spirochaeta sp.]|jgi:KaiC/GvpD/RAD55 family RecA-like ATPase|nr:AAA family ATPase [Spirochaeta sp.]